MTMRAACLVAIVALIGCAGPARFNAEGHAVIPHTLPGTSVDIYDTDAVTGTLDPNGGLLSWGKIAGLLLGGAAGVPAIGAVVSTRVRNSLKQGKIRTAVGWKHSRPPLET